MAKNTSHLHNQIKQEIKELVELLKEYVRTRADSIPPKIRNKIKKFIDDALYRESLLVFKDLGQSLFYNLQLYVKARYNYLREIIRYELLMGKKPLFSHKIIFETALQGKFPIGAHAEVLGISYQALIKSLLELKKHTLVLPIKRKKRRIKIPPYVNYIYEKRRIIDYYKDLLLRELQEAGNECPLDYLISPWSRPIPITSITPRILALIQLIKENEINIIFREKTAIIRRGK